MFAFQCLNASHFIGTFNALASFSELGSLFVQPVDLADLGIKIGFIRMGEPVAVQMWLNDGLFLKAWPHVEEKCFPQSCAASFHRQFRAPSNA
jgi:hypothetical protein